MVVPELMTRGLLSWRLLWDNSVGRWKRMDGLLSAVLMHP